MTCCFRRLALLGCLVLLPLSAWAQGHTLHGVGPVNSSMGGAGVAAPNESIGALTLNPALLTDASGNQVSFATEFFKDGLRVAARAGSLTGTTDPTLQVGVVPAFGWMMRKPDGKLAIGFGLIGVAGFRTDYPQDSSNILLLPQPAGFGRVYTDYTLTKIPLAFAYQATKKLSVGLSFNLYRGTLAIMPLPVVTPDPSPSGATYLPAAGNVVARFGTSVQFGFFYKASDMVSVGASYNTYQKFQEYAWNSVVVNPETAAYGTHRELRFRFDGPATLTFGVGLKPTAKLMLAIDGQYMKFDNVKGLGGPGGVDVEQHRLVGIGWRNIWTLKAGLQYQATDKLALRAGYNHSQTPIRAEIAETSMGTPATFQKHFTAGLGMTMFPNITADLGFYMVPREHVKGPLLSLQTGVVPNSEIDLSNSLKSVQIALNFRF
jgi:long-chain fatty acid transport protein